MASLKRRPDMLMLLVMITGVGILLSELMFGGGLAAIAGW